MTQCTDKPAQQVSQPESQQSRQQSRLRQWGWFATLWLGSLMVVLSISGLIKLVFWYMGS